MGTPISQLAVSLPDSLQHKLLTSDLTLESLRDSTLPALMQKGLLAHEAEALINSMDFYFDQRFRSAVLCPAWPSPCHEVSCEFLEIPDDLLAKLHNNQLEYTYQLAFSRRYTLIQRWGETTVNTLEMALMRFLNAWRNEEIILEEVENDV